MSSKSSRRRELEKKTSSPPVILTCSLCKYSTDKSANLSRHYKTMHEAMKSLVQCCGLSFSNKADYRNHNRASHAHGHSCLVCHRNFSRRALLRRHLSVHTGFREFQCPFVKCNYGSSHKSNLTRHMRIHGLNTSLKASTSTVLEKRQNQQQTFQPDSTTKTSPLENVKNLNLSHLSPTHDVNNNNNNINNTTSTNNNKKNATTTSTSCTTTCSTQSKDGSRVLLSKSYKILRKPKATTTTTTISKKRRGSKTKIKLTHSIEAILSRDERVKKTKKESNSKSTSESSTIERLENVKIIMLPMNFEEVTSTTSPLFSPKENNIIQVQEKEQEKEREQQQYHSNGNPNSYYNDYYFHINNNNTNNIQSQQKVQESKSFQSPFAPYNNNNNNYSSAQYHHLLPLINHTNNTTTNAAAICSSCDYLTPIYSSSSLPVSSILPLQSTSTSTSLSSTSYVRPHEVFSNNSAFHSTFGDFNPSITQLRTNGQMPGQDSRILPIFHSPYAVPIPLPSSTSCYYSQHQTTFQPQVVVSDSFTPLTLAPPSSSTATTLTSTATATVYNSHQNHHLSSPGPSSSDSYGSSPYTLMSFARVSNYQPIEFVSY